MNKTTRKNSNSKVKFPKTPASEIDETSEYDLEGLFIRLAYAIDTIKTSRLFYKI
jgi:hypothetical protein